MFKLCNRYIRFCCIISSYLLHFWSVSWIRNFFLRINILSGLESWGIPKHIPPTTYHPSRVCPSAVKAQNANHLPGLGQQTCAGVGPHSIPVACSFRKQLVFAILGKHSRYLCSQGSRGFTNPTRGQGRNVNHCLCNDCFLLLRKTYSTTKINEEKGSQGGKMKDHYCCEAQPTLHSVGLFLGFLAHRKHRYPGKGHHLLLLSQDRVKGT